MDLSSDNMRALWREAGSVSVAARPRPSLTGPDRVLVDVVRAGLCRTDLYVARGELPGAASRLVLGHELAGRVRAVGAAVTTLAPGDPVAVDPRLRCARCEDCAAGRRCDRGGMIGVQRDGAFCETLELAAARALRLPPGLGFERGALTEPIAACLAVTRAGIATDPSGLIIGRGRIPKLTARILAARGFGAVPIVAPEACAARPAGAAAWVIETGLFPGALDAAARLLRPGGTLVLKSRGLASLSLDPRLWVQKELRLEAVGYGDFGEAVGLAATLELDDLLGPCHPLEGFGEAFELCEGEDIKRFFDPRPPREG